MLAALAPSQPKMLRFSASRRKHHAIEKRFVIASSPATFGLGECILRQSAAQECDRDHRSATVFSDTVNLAGAWRADPGRVGNQMGTVNLYSCDRSKTRSLSLVP